MTETIETPAATAPDPARLIARYRRVMETTEQVPFAFLVRRRKGRRHWAERSLRTKVLLRFFVRWHISAVTSELRRAAHARAALHPTEPSYAAVVGQLEQFEKSLKRVRLRQAFIVSLVSVFLVAFLLARAAPQWDPTLSNLFSSDESSNSSDAAKIGMRDAAGPLAGMTGAALSLNPRELGTALKSFACGTPPAESSGAAKSGGPAKSGGHLQSAGATKDASTGCSARRALISSVTSLILLGIATWIVAFVPLAAFRLKRMLFNLDLDLDADSDVSASVRSQAAVEHVAAASGIYRLEDELFSDLGQRRPRELPFDLAAEASILVVPAWAAVMALIFAAYGIRWDVQNSVNPGDVAALATLALLAITVGSFPAARVVSLRWALRRRAADASGDGAAPALECATLRRRLLAHLVDTLPFVALGVFLVRHTAPFSTGETGGVIAVFVVCPLALGAAHAACIALGGRTMGKLVCGLGVVAGGGNAVSRRRLVVREAVLKGVVFGLPWLLLPELAQQLEIPGLLMISVWWIAIPAWLLPFLAYTCAAWNLRRSPVHDVLLDTTVVRAGRLREPAVALVPAAA